MTFDVVVVGSVNLDLVAQAPRIPRPGETVEGATYHEFPGGKGLNQAVAAARAGASVALVAAVGDDAAGQMLREVVRSEGIDDSWLLTVAAEPTGRALIFVDDDAENSIVVVPGANGHVTWPSANAPVCRVMLGQLEVPVHILEQAFVPARRSGVVTILNPAPALPVPNALLAACSLVVPNEHEVEVLGGSDRLLAVPQLDAVIVTRGARGVDVVSRRPTDNLASVETTDIHHVGAFEVTPIDTTGAGDAFCGNLAARLAHGASRSEAVTWASAAGALATTIRGAVPSLPAGAAVEALVRAQG